MSAAAPRGGSADRTAEARFRARDPGRGAPQAAAMPLPSVQVYALRDSRFLYTASSMSRMDVGDRWRARGALIGSPGPPRAGEAAASPRADRRSRTARRTAE